MQKLYRKRRWSSVFLCAFALLQTSGPLARAQSRKITPQNPRATAILVWHGPENSPVPKDARLVPLTIRDEGRIFDANIYKSAPIPMALEQNTVYEVQRGGERIGFFTVGSGAYKLRSGDWYSLGSWLAKPAANASYRPPSESGTGSPRFGRSGDSPADHDKSPSGSGSGSGSGDSSGGDPDRPRLKRAPSPDSAPASDAPSSHPSSTAPSPTTSSPSSGTDAGGNSGGQSGGQSGGESNDPDRPKLKRREPESPKPGSESGSSGSTGGSGSSDSDNDPDRPRLQRKASGGPGPQSADDLEVLKKMSNPGQPLQVRVAVSDAVNTEAHPYVYEMQPEQSTRIRAEMLKMANAELAKATGQSVAPAPSAARARRGAPGRAAAPPPQELQDLMIKSFDLSYDNSPTVVLTGWRPARAAPPAANAVADKSSSAGTNTGANTTPDTKTERNRFITLIARIDLEGNPRKVFASATDTSRLDVLPFLQLVDVIDVDGSGRGNLLFREYYQDPAVASRLADDLKFIIYKITRDDAQKVFESPHGE